MGLVKQWMLEEEAKQRQQECREWLQDKLGREVSDAEVDAAWDDFRVGRRVSPLNGQG